MRIGVFNQPQLLHNLRSKPTYFGSRTLLPRLSPPSRTLSASHRLRQTKERQSQAPIQFRHEKSESIKLESFEEPPKAKQDEAPKTDGLLSEQTVSNKEQRKADWAIMKEMARYLWPKVKDVTGGKVVAY